MNKALYILVIAILFSCEQKVRISSVDDVNWGKRKVDHKIPDSLISGTSYLSVYSQIYSETEHLIHNLTVTVSIRNTNLKDTIFLKNANYYNTKGELVRTYFNEIIFVAPLETVEIVVDQLDKEGGTGANFLFDWKIPKNTHEPFFESVMISAYGNQGLSFTSQGITVDRDDI